MKSIYLSETANVSTGRVPLSPDSSDDERRLAAIGVQFENGDVSRENVAWLLNQCADQGERLREAYDSLVEAGFACMTADDIAESLGLSPEERTAKAAIVKRIFEKAYAHVIRSRRA